MNDRRRTIGGFSLVELLVTMAIVTILVAVVVPCLIQARNRARAASCAANLKQIGSSVMLYCQDFSDRLPHLQGSPFAGSHATAERPDGTSATHARELLGRRLSPGVFRCANDCGASDYGFEQVQGSVYSRTGSSYVPWSTTRPGKYGLKVNGVPVSLLAAPSAQVLFRDYGGDWHGYRSRSGVNVRQVQVANAVFADGHAKATPVISLATQRGSYVCVAANRTAETALVMFSGTADGCTLDLTGSSSVLTDQQQFRLQLSGLIAGNGFQYEVDRVFLFASDTRLEGALDQVVRWAESVMSE